MRFRRTAERLGPSSGVLAKPSLPGSPPIERGLLWRRTGRQGPYPGFRRNRLRDRRNRPVVLQAESCQRDCATEPRYGGAGRGLPKPQSTEFCESMTQSSAMKICSLRAPTRGVHRNNKNQPTSAGLARPWRVPRSDPYRTHRFDLRADAAPVLHPGLPGEEPKVRKDQCPFAQLRGQQYSPQLSA